MALLRRIMVRRTTCCGRPNQWFLLKKKKGCTTHRGRIGAKGVQTGIVFGWLGSRHGESDQENVNPKLVETKSRPRVEAFPRRTNTATGVKEAGQLGDLHSRSNKTLGQIVREKNVR